MILDVGSPECRKIFLTVAMPGSEWSKTFIQGMLNRMGVSYHKYGRIPDAYPDRLNAVASLQTRLGQYLADGNTEWLIDVANFAMIEFMHPGHPEAAFEPQDSDTSPGRTSAAGAVTFKGNRSV